MSTHNIVWSVAVRLLCGVVVQGRTAKGVVTVGRGQLIDWRYVRSGEEIELVDQTAADFAQLFVALVGSDAAAEALDGDAPTPDEAPVLPQITTYAPMTCGRRRSAVDVHGCTVLVTPSCGDGEEGTAIARRLAERIAKLQLEDLEGA